jgi:hypothetical protein
MKVRRIISMGLVVLVAAGAALLLFSRNSARMALEETRRALRQQGFKIDLAEFDLSASAELRARAATLTNADLAGAAFRGADSARRAVLTQDKLDLMPTVSSNAALVVWREDNPPAQSGPYFSLPRSQSAEEFWPALREIFSEDRAALDAACAAAMSGAIRFPLQASHGSSMLLPHLAALRNLNQLLGTRAMLELHDGNKDTAWTNVLACTRLVTAWDPEPTDVSHGVRIACAYLAHNAAWQALQAGGWADDRLAHLQHEWESIDFFRGLPETAAFARAGAADICQRERQEPLPASQFFNELRRSPRNAWYGFIEHWRRVRYRHYGSYEDERALLLYYRDRELQVRRAVQAPTWSEMRLLPGVTNMVPFRSKYPSRMQSLLNMRQMRLSIPGRGQGLLGRAPEAEARRRLLITAIALERYRGRHGGYPKTLQELVPELVQSPPVDFMDGKPLRYCLGEDGHFVLYSVGLDSADDGGRMLARGRRRPAGDSPFRLAQQPIDLVWPRPASAAEVQEQQAEEERQAELERTSMQRRLAEEERQMEDARQTAIEKLLAEAEARKAAPESSEQAAAEASYQGRPLSVPLRNQATAGTNRLTLDELLTVRQVTSGEYDGDAIFELPVSYDAATNIGRLHLVVDGHLDAASRGEEGERQTWERATNGNCLLGWTTTYDPPGRHAVQAEFIATKDEDKEETALKVRGPAVAFVSTNLCRFDSAYDHFDARGVTLYARLAESNGVYAIELKDPAGARVKTLTGTTSNGVIKAHWDLIDDRGRHYTNDSLDSVFQVTLPGSGRSQRLKGP